MGDAQVTEIQAALLTRPFRDFGKSGCNFKNDFGFPQLSKQDKREKTI